MPTSSTNNVLPENVISQVVDNVTKGSLTEIRRDTKIEAAKIDVAVAQFFDLFADKVIGTKGAPKLGEWTPTYAPYSKGYAAYKGKRGNGWFHLTGALDTEVRNLGSNATNILGKSSSVIGFTSGGLRKGFSVTDSGAIQSQKTGRFVPFGTGLKDFTVTVTHKPFGKLPDVITPMDIEKDLFEGAYESIYIKLTNAGGGGRKYRSGFYSYLMWWMQVYLKGIL